MTVAISDQQLVVGSLADKDALGLPADDPITGVTWTATDVADPGTDVTVVSGDNSTGTNDNDPNKVTVQATGTGVGDVTINGTITTQSGASLVVTDTVTVNGGVAASSAIGWGAPQAIPAPPAGG